MGFALSVNTQERFVTVDCFKCGVTFAVKEELNGNWLRDKTEFFCPNGHGQSYVESEADRLRKQLADKERALAWEKQRAASLEQQVQREKKATARLKKRVSRGVCPCCHRTVGQMAKHMASKHPEFVAEQK